MNFLLFLIYFLQDSYISCLHGSVTLLTEILILLQEYYKNSIFSEQKNIIVIYSLITSACNAKMVIKIYLFYFKLYLINSNVIYKYNLK